MKNLAKAILPAAWATGALLALAGASLAAPPMPGGAGEDPAAKAAQKRRGFEKLRQILRTEPTARDVQQATLRFYKLEPDRIARMARAANLKGLIPEIETSVDTSRGNTFTNTRDGLYPQLPALPGSTLNQTLPGMNGMPGMPYNPYKEIVNGSSDQLLWRVRAVWNFDRLLFNAEELDVRSLNSIEENLVREVTTLYFSRRRLLANILLSPPDDEEEMFYQQLRLDEMTSTVDALSGGFFAGKAFKGDLMP